MRRLDISNTHPLVLEAWEYGTVEGGSRCHVMGHPDGYSLLTLDDLCALRFLQDLRKLPCSEPEAAPFPLVTSFLPGGLAYAGGGNADVFVCAERVTPLGRAERLAVMQAARRTFATTVTPPDDTTIRGLLESFRDLVRSLLPDSESFEQELLRLVDACAQAVQWWQTNPQHVPREGFVFGTALTQCAWATPRGAVLLPHIFCND